MPRASRTRIQLAEEDKKKRRREQKKLSIRRARAKMDESALEERRRQDRERYRRKKEQGKIKTIKDHTPREQRQIRRMWREKAKLRREKEKNTKNALRFTEQDTPPSSLSFARTEVGNAVVKRNGRRLRIENNYLRKRILDLESKVAKYRMRLVRSTNKLGNKRQIPNKPKCKKVQEMRKVVQEFLCQDEYSRLTSGKKDTITRRKVKQQIRFLNDSLLNLHKVFVNKSGVNISYETFRRYRPFWVLFPKVDARNTCLCAIHANNNFIIRSLYNAKMIPYRSITNLLKDLCCNNTLSVACLENKCFGCKDKTLQCNRFNVHDTVSFERWITKTVSVVVKNTTKQCRKTIKEKVQTTKKSLLEQLNLNLPTLRNHVANMLHQIKSIQLIKQNLSTVDGLLHIDFSENYNFKYGQEVQSAHFGGSKSQLSLHTSIYYNTDLDPPNNYTNTTSFCTVSENLRHDPTVICVHLIAIIKRIKELSPNLQTLHILSDGPLTQYRNKSMFFLLATLLNKEFSVTSIIWHFTERGHGKGAPDGVGGCIKRICDSHVAKGNDVSCLDDLMTCLSVNCKGIEVYKIDESRIPTIDQSLNESATRPFKGTLKIHQVTWNIQDPNVIHARRLSCLDCAAHEICSHFEIGQIQIQHKVPNSPRNSVLSDSHISNLSAISPQAGPSKYHKSSSETHFIQSSTSSGISDASTESISPGHFARFTPDNPTENFSSPSKRPIKRKRRIFFDDSESSVEMSPTPKKRQMPFMCDDSGDENIF